MYVSVAIGAARTNFLEDQAEVALRAGDLRVHPAERISCLIVIELRIGADWLPTRVGVALLAGNRKCAMRIGDLRLRASDTGPRVVGRLL